MGKNWAGQVPVVKTRTTIVNPVLQNDKIYRISDNHVEYDGGFNQPTQVETVETIMSTNSVGKNKSRANSCLHTKVVKSSVYAGPLDFTWNPVANPTLHSVNTGYIPQQLINLGQSVTAAKAALGGAFGSAYLRGSGQTLMDQNFDSLRPDLTDVSLPNFLIDLGQLKGLLSLWNFRKSVVSNIANANLTTQFGWRPTIGDVASMLGCLTVLQLQIQEWNSRLGRITTRTKRVLFESSAKTGNINPPSGFNSEYLSSWRANVTRTVSAHISFKPKPILALNNADLILRGALDKLGVELNPAIIWDAIPFSFVVDWFLNVGNYLNSLRIDALELPFELMDTYLQYKEQFTCDCRIIHPASVNVPYLVYPGATQSETTFHRMLVGPSYSLMSSLGWHFPSLNQALLGVSLGLQRR